MFLAWEPHPMNMRFDLKYLAGGDAVFGAELRRRDHLYRDPHGLQRRVPERRAGCSTNLKFTLRGESEMMAAILDRHRAAGRRGGRVAEGQSDGGQGLARGRAAPSTAGRRSPRCAQRAPAAQPAASSSGSSSHKIPVGDAMAVAIDYVKAHGTLLFDGISIVIRGMVDGLTALLRALPAPLADRSRSPRSPGCCAAPGRSPCSWSLALLFILNQGYWLATLETLSLVDGRHPGLGAHRRAARNRRRAPAAAVRGAAPGARSDADPADLRVPDSDPGAVRTRRGARA